MITRSVALAVLVSLAACGGDEPSGTNTPTPSPTSSESPTSSPSPSPSPVAARPQTIQPTQSGEAWAVYLAAGDPTSDEFNARLALLESKDLPNEPHDVNCDQGAADALGISDEEQVVAAYFATEQDARAWAKTIDVETLAIAKVMTYCLD